MNTLQIQAYLWPYVISNVVGLLFLWAAASRPAIARTLFVLLFGWASWFNYTTAHAHPEVYLDYANAAISLYQDFIRGWFSGHVTLMVSLIAAGQGIIAAGMLLRGWWVRLACIGAIIFLLAIAPLGFYAGFPFSISVSAAAYLVLRRKELPFIWKTGKNKKRMIYKQQHA